MISVLNTVSNTASTAESTSNSDRLLFERLSAVKLANTACTSVQLGQRVCGEFDSKVLATQRDLADAQNCNATEGQGAYLLEPRPQAPLRVDRQQR